MKPIRNAILGLSVLGACLTAGAALAHHDTGHDDMTAISRQLNLTPTQEKQLATLHEGAARQMKSIMSNKSLDVAGRHAAIMNLHHNLMASASKFLNADQRQKLAKIIHEHMQQAMGAGAK